MSSTQIYEQHYRRLDASIPLRTQRWIPIAREGLKALFARRAYLALMALAWLPVLVRLVQVYFATRFPEARRIVPIDARLFSDFLGQQIPMMLLMAALGGAGLIANDMRTGGLLLYLSRPLTLRDYITGKLTILVVTLSMVTLIPGLALFFSARSLAPDVLGDVGSLLLVPKIILQSLVMVLPTAALILACRPWRAARASPVSDSSLFSWAPKSRGASCLARPAVRTRPSSRFSNACVASARRSST